MTSSTMTDTKDFAGLIDEEVRKFVEAGEATARKILEDHRPQLEIIAQGLLEHETLSREEIEARVEQLRAKHKKVAA